MFGKKRKNELQAKFEDIQNSFTKADDALEKIMGMTEKMMEQNRQMMNDIMKIQMTAEPQMIVVIEQKTTTKETVKGL